MDNDCGPLEKVKDLSSTLVKLYLAEYPAARVSVCATKILGLALIRRTISSASRNLNLVVDVPSWFMRKKPDFALVSLICNRTPGSRKTGTLQISLCRRPYNSVTLLCFCLSHLAMKPLFLFSPVPAVGLGSQGLRSPLSIYQ